MMETNSYLKNPAGTRERYFSRRFSFGKISEHEAGARANGEERNHTVGGVEPAPLAAKLSYEVPIKVVSRNERYGGVGLSQLQVWMLIRNGFLRASVASVPVGSSKICIDRAELMDWMRRHPAVTRELLKPVDERDADFSFTEVLRRDAGKEAARRQCCRSFAILKKGRYVQ